MSESVCTVASLDSMRGNAGKITANKNTDDKIIVINLFIHIVNVQGVQYIRKIGKNYLDVEPSRVYRGTVEDNLTTHTSSSLCQKVVH